MITKKVDVDVSKSIKNYRLNNAGITENNQECIIFIVIPSKKQKKG